MEDNPDAAETMLEVLEDWGYTVHLCPDGPAALSAVQDASPDVVLMDIGLPGMDGYEVARRLRGLPALAAARFMALTGYGQESDRVHSREAGFDAHLVKPVDLACLRRLLAAATRPMA